MCDEHRQQADHPKAVMSAGAGAGGGGRGGERCWRNPFWRSDRKLRPGGRAGMSCALDWSGSSNERELLQEVLNIGRSLEDVGTLRRPVRRKPFENVINCSCRALWTIPRILNYLRKSNRRPLGNRNKGGGNQVLVLKKYLIVK